MRGGNFAFDCAHSLYYKCHKIIFKRSGSYTGSPDRIKNLKATINPINKRDNQWFQYPITVALDHK